MSQKELLRMQRNNLIAMQAKEIKSSNSTLVLNKERSPSSTSSSAHALTHML
jgi:hypothetical protein